MGTNASQITSLTVVYSTVYSGADQRKHQSSASLAFVWGIHRDRWIPRTKGQLRGKCFHLMTSSWHSRFGVNETSLTKHIRATRHNLWTHICPQPRKIFTLKCITWIPCKDVKIDMYFVLVYTQNIVGRNHFTWNSNMVPYLTINWPAT